MEFFETEIYRRYQHLISEKFFSSKDDVPKQVRLSDIVDRYDAFCFDGYGTLYNRGSFVYDGALEWFRLLRERGKSVRLVTNAASDVDAVLAADADKRGFDFKPEETVSSGSLLKNLACELRSGNVSWTCASEWLGSDNVKMNLSEVYYIGRETGKHVLENNGICAVENPAEPIVAVSSSTATEEMFAHAVSILRRRNSVLIVLNSDAWAPKIDGTRAPVSGALSERLRRESACEANGGKGASTFYLGKPFPQIWKRVRETLAADARVLMIGDTLGTDVYGAKVADFDSALVVGRNVPECDLKSDEKALGVRPDWYLVV